LGANFISGEYGENKNRNLKLGHIVSPSTSSTANGFPQKYPQPDFLELEAMKFRPCLVATFA